MSFSSEVKAELFSLEAPGSHCRRAELAAIISGSGRITIENGRAQIEVVTEKEALAKRYVHLLWQVSGIATEAVPQQHTQQKGRTSYRICLDDPKETGQLLQILKIAEPDGTLRVNLDLTSRRLLQRSCCKRAFLRGAYLAAGSMSDPKKSYHFEIVCETREKAEQIQGLFQSFDLDAKLIERKKHIIVYLKEGSQIVDALNVMGAHLALMDLENVRILKEMRNDVNRRVNCETANIHKTVSAAYRQQEAIRFLQAKGALGELAEALQEIATLRMEYPESSIKELGTYCVPPVGKSGVNHRLRKLEEIAQRMGYERG